MSFETLTGLFDSLIPTHRIDRKAFLGNVLATVQRESRLVQYLKPARPFPGDQNMGQAVAEFDLSNQTAGGVNLAQDYGRAAHAAWRSAGRRVAASPDLDGCRLRIEVRFEQGIRKPKLIVRRS
jgi:hypothetical protein